MCNDLNITVAQVIKKYRLLSDRGRSKSLGQHFLCDESLLDKIVSCALPFGNDDIIEIGPGPCGLTRSIIKLVGDRKIFCVEKDTSLKPVHENLLQYSNADVSFVYGDALNIKFQSLTEKTVTVISNLPYNVGTQILINLLHDLSKISKLVLMFQKEVADRICAKPGTKDYGRLSIISRLLCNIEKCFDVSKLAFFPVPKVDSTVIRLIPKADRPSDISRLERLTSICFQHRRKTILAILKRIYRNATECLVSCGIDCQARPENISPEKFLELSEKLEIS